MNTKHWGDVNALSATEVSPATPQGCPRLPHYLSVTWSDEADTEHEVRLSMRQGEEGFWLMDESTLTERTQELWDLLGDQAADYLERMGYR